METAQKEDLKLRLGNLVLAIWLSTVPTAITYGVFGLHGLNICRSLNSNIEIVENNKIKKICEKTAWETTSSYIFLIGFFITLPTWYWFYFCMKRKQKE